MRLYRERLRLPCRGWVLSILIFSAMLGLFWHGFGVVSSANRSEGKETLLASLRRAAVCCYSAEGAYPPSVEYMEAHYGVSVNHQQYAVQYELAGSNIMPSITVYEKGAGEGASHG